MAEQINKNDYINHPDRIGGFNYYSLGETTIKQLQQNNLISSKTRKFQNKKPDAIVTDDEKDIVVYIENKDIGKLSTADDIQSAIDQEIDVAKAVNAPIFVVTDTVDTYWINTLTGERIISEDGTELRVVFKPNENKRQLEKLIKYIRLSISATNNQLKKVVYLDPTDLATAVHQKIWIAKNSSPETCLYTLDVYRFDTEENHLEEAVNQYNLFKSTPDRSKFKAISYDEEGKPYIDKKCKLIDIQKFYDAVDTSWIIDNFWSDEEKIELGFKKEVNIMTIPELQTFIDNVIEAMEEYRGDLECLI